MASVSLRHLRPEARKTSRLAVKPNLSTDQLPRRMEPGRSTLTFVGGTSTKVPNFAMKICIACIPPVGYEPEEDDPHHKTATRQWPLLMMMVVIMMVVVVMKMRIKGVG